MMILCFLMYIFQMEAVVQQNAALVEETTGATQTMAHEAQALLQMLARFNLGDRELSAPPQHEPHRALLLSPVAA